MSPEALGIVATAIVGGLGILGTYLTARLQANKQVQLLEKQQAEDRKRELRTERRAIYSALLSEITEIEALVDYFHRIRKSIAKNEDLAPNAEAIAREAVGAFDDVGHFKRLHDLAAQAALVGTNELVSAVGPAVSAAMRVVASMLQPRDADDLGEFRAHKAELMNLMLYELRLDGYDKPYSELMHEFSSRPRGVEGDPAP